MEHGQPAEYDLVCIFMGKDSRGSIAKGSDGG